MIVIISLKILFLWVLILLMFPSIDDVSSLETVSETLENRETDFPPAGFNEKLQL